MSYHQPPYGQASGFPPAQSGQNKNRQARATAGILNTVRLIGTIGFVGLAVITLLGGLIGAASSENGAVTLVFGVVGALFALLFAALFYAVVGWFVDTLSLLTQIAENTAR